MDKTPVLDFSFPPRPGTLDEWQSALAPLSSRVSDALSAGGCQWAQQAPWQEWERYKDTERPGVLITRITPAWVGTLARDYIEVIHFDTPAADHRTPCAQYAAVLETAGFRVEMEEQPGHEGDGVTYAPYPRLKVYADANPTMCAPMDDSYWLRSNDD